MYYNLTLYVDDLFIFTNDLRNILLEVKEWLKSKFQMKYKTKLSYEVRIEINKNSNNNKGTIMSTNSNT